MEGEKERFHTHAHTQLCVEDSDIAVKLDVLLSLRHIHNSKETVVSNKNSNLTNECLSEQCLLGNMNLSVTVGKDCDATHS